MTISQDLFSFYISVTTFPITLKLYLIVYFIPGKRKFVRYDCKLPSHQIFSLRYLCITSIRQDNLLMNIRRK